MGPVYGVLAPRCREGVILLQPSTGKPDPWAPESTSAGARGIGALALAVLLAAGCTTGVGRSRTRPWTADAITWAEKTAGAADLSTACELLELDRSTCRRGIWALALAEKLVNLRNCVGVLRELVGGDHWCPAWYDYVGDALGVHVGISLAAWLWGDP